MDWYPWIVFAHILGAFGFAAGHGVSMLMALRLRSERDSGKLVGMLDLSLAGMNWITWSGLLLLASGIAGGFVGDHWGKGWIWLSLGILVAVSGAMTPIGATYYNRVRVALGLPLPRAKDAQPTPPVPAAELDALLTSSRPLILLAIGGVGFGAIVFLMHFKPF